MSVVNDIQAIFAREAKMSPMLLADLANMEKYIAESYQSRSVVELLQNADDANAKRFFIRSNNDCIIVANDGRKFNKDDAMSICRSGVSTKNRDGKTIGYRGIGFKSVVNLAERVHIISGTIRMTFSRELTKNYLEVSNKVPLIRIPHIYTPISNHEGTINKLIEKNFNSIFIFEHPKLNNLNEDLGLLDSSILLFLKNICELEIHSVVSKKISVSRKELDYKEIIVINDNDNEQERWLVIRDEKCNALAFLLNDCNEIIELGEDRAVIHSFMPTKDKVGLPIKINGDFSTDPSRTRVVYDEISKQTLLSCSRLVINSLKDCISNKEQYDGLGLFSVFANFKKDRVSGFTLGVKIKEYFFDCIKSELNNIKWYNGVETENLRVNPEWLNSYDFKKFCRQLKYTPLCKELEKDYPGILKFSNLFELKTLDLDQVLDLLNNLKPTINGSVDVICEIIRQYRFNCNSKIKVKIKNANLIYFKSGIYSSNSKINDFNFDPDFYDALNMRINDDNDLKWFIKLYFEDLSIQVLKANNILQEEHKQVKGNDTQLLKLEVSRYTSKATLPPINKWRSVEQNLAAFLERDSAVKKVIDVSKSNLGYDIEVHYNDDRVRYIEVKSVERLGAPISLTNNEYSTANELKEEYLLAIVEQTDLCMEVCYIENPINHLNLIKRVTRWEWICDDYSGTFLNYSF